MVCVGLFSTCVALARWRHAPLIAGMSYWLIGPVQFLHGYLMGKRRRRIAERAASRAREPAAA